MSVVTYTALREFEPSLNAFAKNGVDISAAATDDSFNSSSTVLSGLNTDEWVLVSGFANAANNGWFQVKSGSTSTKILQVTAPVTHLRLPAVSGNYASTPDTVANSIATDQGLICRAALTDWTPAAVQTLVAKWNTTGNQRAIALSVNTDGTLNLSWSADGTVVISKNSTVATGIADLGIKYVWASLRVNNGAAGNDVKFFLSDNGTTWTQLGTTVTTAGTTAVFNSTAGLEVGSISGGTAQLASGDLYYAALAGGLTATPVAAAFDASRGVRNGTTVVAASGETWTINTSGTPPALLQGPSLVAVSAGPSISITGYKRGLNQSYSLEFGGNRLDRSVKVQRSEALPMGGGAPEVLLYRRETFDEITTTWITEAQLLQWREFMASVEGGEVFTYDKYGTVAVPVSPKQATLASTEYSEAREGMDFVYRITFTVRLLS